VALAHIPATWETPPVVLVAAALAALLFVQAFVRLRRRRPDHAPWSRAVLFAAGLGLLVLPVLSPLDAMGDNYLLSAHMLQHVLIGDAAIALLVFAVRGPLVFFLLPPPVACARWRVPAAARGALVPAPTAGRLRALGRSDLRLAHPAVLRLRRSPSAGA
jgi:cytochrome c oxidase assembly factor CtaG